MKPKSDNLFHFTKSLDVLKLILKNGIQPRYCLEDVEWVGRGKYKNIAFPMSCFCDIPLTRISEHTDFYGDFGLGLTKEWGAKNGLNPVVYSPQGGVVQNLMKYLMDFKFEDPDSKELCNHHSYKLFSLLKPTFGKMVISGKVIEKEFYQESEWRYVPPVQTLITEDTFQEDKDESNKKILEHTLKFSPSDIRYIFVQSDSDIPHLIDFINAEMGRFPLNDVKILLSRIISLDVLSKDL